MLNTSYEKAKQRIITASYEDVTESYMAIATSWSGLTDPKGEVTVVRYSSDEFERRSIQVSIDDKLNSMWFSGENNTRLLRSEKREIFRRFTDFLMVNATQDKSGITYRLEFR